MLDSKWYANLALHDSSTLYIRGYTEALRYYRGVRIVQEKDLKPLVVNEHTRILFSHNLHPPFYFIPLLDNNNCYGYVLKGDSKMTPAYSLRDVKTPGLDSLTLGEKVVLVEGIKDSFIFRALGIQALPMLTSAPSRSLLQYLKFRNCPLIIIMDNDGEVVGKRKKSIERLLSSLDYFEYRILIPEDFNDTGDIFLPDYKSKVKNFITHTFKEAYNELH